jgi:hypothetical protein
LIDPRILSVKMVEHRGQLTSISSIGDVMGFSSCPSQTLSWGYGRVLGDPSPRASNYYLTQNLDALHR